MQSEFSKQILDALLKDGLGHVQLRAGFLRLTAKLLVGIGRHTAYEWLAHFITAHKLSDLLDRFDSCHDWHNVYVHHYQVVAALPFPVQLLDNIDCLRAISGNVSLN